MIIKNQYNDFKAKNWKFYDKATDTYRLSVFANNMKNINAHNAAAGQTYKKGINKFADLTEQ